MLRRILITLLCFFFYNSFAQVFINELDSDTPSVDDKEFIELKSVTPNFSLNGYVLVFFNGTGSLANRSYYVIDLSGNTTDMNGIFHVGNLLVSPVPGRIFPDSVVQNGPDGIGLYQGTPSNFPNNTMATTTNLVDAIVYSTSSTATQVTTLMNLLGVTTQWNEGAGTGGSSVNSLQRKPDGTYESKAPTPGANNDGSGFIYNGITISTSATQVIEGGAFTINFTTQQPVTSNLTFTFTLNNGTFNEQDYTGNTTVFIPTGSTTFSTVITTVDDTIDEGDEVAIIRFGTLPFGYNRRNDLIQVRIVDNDFHTLPFGTPLNPTFGNVQSTAPNGYYSSLEGLSGNALKQALQDIIANPNVVRAHTYGDVVEILRNADQNPLNSNQVWMMYVESPRAKLDYQTGSSTTGKWNREHIYPQSRGGFSNATSDVADGINIWVASGPNMIAHGHSDAHHIRAEDGRENTNRSNKDYGLNDYNGPAGTLGSWKGDVARSLFYMAVRYNGLQVVNGNLPDSTVGQIGDLATLLQWNMSDPRDDFEMNRNNYIYNWQMNRNPFIDHPSLANYIFGANFGQPWFSSLSTTSFDETSIGIYPNPANASFEIFGLTDDTTIEVYNALGARVMSQSMSSGMPINCSGWAKGLYFVKLLSNNHTVTKKVLVK